MRKKRNNEFAGINSMAELKMAQTNVARELDMRRHGLMDDWQMLNRIFSIDYQLSRAVDRVAKLRNRTLNVMHGFTFASRLVDKWREYRRKTETKRTMQPNEAYEECGEPEYDPTYMVEQSDVANDYSAGSRNE